MGEGYDQGWTWWAVGVGAPAAPAGAAPAVMGWALNTHRAAVVDDCVGEAAVALAPQLDLVGALEEQGLLEVASLLVHVGHAVLAVVGNVLGGLGGHQAQECQLDSHIGRVGVFAAIFELCKRRQ